MAYGSTLGISALCFWLALCSKNFIAPVAIGLLLWFAAPAALENGWPHVDKYVFAIPITTVIERYQTGALFHQLLSFGYAIVFFAIALVQFRWQRR